MTDVPGNAATIRVEVVFAAPRHQALLPLELPADATVADAISASGIERRFPEYDLALLPVGIWGRQAGRDQPLSDGDRVEIYRPLAADPRDARRTLAAHGKAMGQHDNDDGTPGEGD